MTRAEYIQRQKRLQNRIMNAHLKPVYTAINHLFLEVADDVEANGPEQALKTFNRDHQSNLDEIYNAILHLYQQATSQAQSGLVVSKADPTISIIPRFQQFITDVMQYLKSNLLNKVVLPIEQTSIKLIRAILNQGIKDGDGFLNLARKIRTSDVNQYRARMIVRTEAVRAMNYAQLVEAGKGRFETTKQWIAIEDKRTRTAHTHAGVDGERQDLWTPFSNGLMCPGDPEGDAAQTINCRCTMGYYIKYETDGITPILKK